MTGPGPVPGAGGVQGSPRPPANGNWVPPGTWRPPGQQPHTGFPPPGQQPTHAGFPPPVQYQRPIAVRPPALPTQPREYQEFWRTLGVPVWKPLVAVLLGAVGFLLISLLVSAAGIFYDIATSGTTIDEVLAGLLEGEISQAVFIANSVALGLMVALSFLLQRIVGQPPGFLSSVVGRVRWRWMLTCFGISIVAVGLLTAVELALVGWDGLNLAPQPGWPLLLLAILLVTPFQAAGEEYLVRGVLFRAVGALLPHRLLGLALGAVVSSLVFVLLHSAADPWLNLVYFCMGLLFCHLTWRTGGLEAAVAMHAANNLLGLAFVPFQEWGGIFDRSEGVAGPEVLIQLVLLVAAGVVIEVLARRRGIVRRSAPAGDRAI